MTTLQLLNKMLRGLRQFDLILADSETSITDDYLQMMLQFLNEAKEEIEESGWPWYALRKNVTVTVVAAQIEYTLSIASDADVDTNDRTRLLYDNVSYEGPTEGFYMSNSSEPQVFETSTSSEYRLREVSVEQMERWHLTDNDEVGKPVYFSLYNNGTYQQMKLHPTPDAAYTLKVRAYVPQDELLATDITTALSIPDRPTWTKALFKANEERGAELGKPGSSLWTTYLDAHGAATAAEMSLADQTVFLDR